MQKKEINTFSEAVEYLYDVPRFTSKNSVEDTKAYLKHMGSPDEKLKIIHVAGTNGKGSVCAYMRCILEEAGYKVAVFTSPHLVDVRERFLIGGEMVSEQEFLDSFLKIYEDLDWQALEKGEGYHPTFFEYLFFMAMDIFSRKDVDYCILETGLGGRLDATNSVSKKELSVITRISLEHVEYLGDTIEKIAGEKAGIMMRNVPVVFTDVVNEASEVFVKRAKELGCTAYSVSKADYAFSNFKNKNIDFSMNTRYYGYISLTLQTIARYQMENAALAVKAIEVLDQGRSVTVEQLTNGVGKCIWQGRMEEIYPQVYVDGAHNEDGIRAFLETVSGDGHEDGERTLLFSVVQDKDYVHMIEGIVNSGLFSKIAIAHMQTKRSTKLEQISKLFKEGNVSCIEFNTVEEAFRVLLHEKKAKERIYIAGSLYLVGEIKDLCNRIVSGL